MMLVHATMPIANLNLLLKKMILSFDGSPLVCSMYRRCHMYVCCIDSDFLQVMTQTMSTSRIRHVYVRCTGEGGDRDEIGFS